jgi:hypothetical protein
MMQLPTKDDRSREEEWFELVLLLP